MKMKWILLVLSLVPSLLFAQKLSEAEREILTLQDQRSLGNGALMTYLANNNPQLRSRALIALANIQDTTTIPQVVALLNDPDGNVRGASAFALGQIGTHAAQASLLGKLRVEKDLNVVGRLFEALGRIGDEKALDAVVEDSLHEGSAFVRSEQLLGIARFALRGIKNERSICFCFEQTSHPSAEVRWKALFALWRSAPHGLVDVEIAKRQEDLARLADDADVDVRVNLITLVGRSKAAAAVELVKTIQEADQRHPNWLVAVQIVRSLAALSTMQSELVNDLVAYLGSSNDHVTIAALQALDNMTKPLVMEAADTVKLRETLIALSAKQNPAAELTRGEAFIALARFFPEDFSRMNFLADKKLSVREQTKVLEALTFIPTGRSLSIMLRLLDDPNVRISMAAWDFIHRLLTPALIMTKIRAQNPDWVDARPSLYRKTLNSLKRKDMAITQLVSTALADTTFFGMFKEANLADSLAIALKSAFEGLSSPDDVEAMQAVAQAMGTMKDKRFVPALEKALRDPDKTVVVVAAEALRQITGKDYSAQIPKSTKAVHSDYDWSTLESLTASAKIVIETSKGTITLQLLKDDAPFTVLSFVKLVRKRFYEGLQFHRVVPNFVIQGGDPRGDGWGGPGYAIRSEFSFARFVRGAVGVASAGKDTEGCQFFITHTPTPHLDGRYTVFARVLSGQEVVDRIQIGDTIKKISVN
jgi:cyclophilin family peptidyl-prolyl cis-trans isomerase/HEAT repeat protein